MDGKFVSNISLFHAQETGVLTSISSISIYTLIVLPGVSSMPKPHTIASPMDAKKLEVHR